MLRKVMTSLLLMSGSWLGLMSPSLAMAQAPGGSNASRQGYNQRLGIVNDQGSYYRYYDPSGSAGWHGYRGGQTFRNEFDSYNSRYDLRRSWGAPLRAHASPAGPAERSLPRAGLPPGPVSESVPPRRRTSQDGRRRPEVEVRERHGFDARYPGRVPDPPGQPGPRDSPAAGVGAQTVSPGLSRHIVRSAPPAATERRARWQSPRPNQRSKAQSRPKRRASRSYVPPLPPAFQGGHG